jgi:hypothetical protein
MATQRRTIVQAAAAVADPGLHVLDPSTMENVRHIVEDALYDLRRNVVPPFEPHHVESMIKLVRDLVDILLDWQISGWGQRHSISGNDPLVSAYRLLDELGPCLTLVDHWADARRTAPVQQADPTVWVTNISEVCKNVKRSFVEFGEVLLQLLA